MLEAEVNGYTVKVDKDKSEVSILLCGRIVEKLDVSISREVGETRTVALIKKGNLIKAFQIAADLTGAGTSILQAASEYVKTL
jgi:hypothetical protein